MLAAAGWGSRRVCEELIAAGRVTVNGEVAVLGRRVDPEHDLVEVDGAPLGVRPGPRVLPAQQAARAWSRRPAIRRAGPTVVELVPAEPRVFPVGRLDADTEGLLLLTNDGELAHRLTHPSHGVEKEYLAEVEAARRRRRAPHAARRHRARRRHHRAGEGVSQPDPGVLRITIHEGRNRQVRRMCEAIGHPGAAAGPGADRAAHATAACARGSGASSTATS